jgi:segregation and condensation protein B
MVMPDEFHPTSAADLGRSYAAVVGDASWEVDGAPPGSPAPSDIEAAPPSLPRIIEAMLFIGGSPLTATRACEIVRGLTPEQFAAAIDDLTHDYRRQGRPYAIEPRGPGFVLALRPRYLRVVDKLHGGVREARLSTAAVDVLALVAYRQPATKAEIDSLRGAESGSLLRQLVRRGLIQIAYRGDASQKEVSYGTTPRFLDMFGLQSLDDLPRTRDLAPE